MEFSMRVAGTFLFFFFFAFSFSQISLPMEIQRFQLAEKHRRALPKFNPAIQQVFVLAKPDTARKPVTKLGTTVHHPSLAIYAGSLRANVSRLAAQFGWKRLIWDAQYDYQWTGTTHITADALPTLLARLLKGYPLQAVFYQGNHILVIKPRKVA